MVVNVIFRSYFFLPSSVKDFLNNKRVEHLSVVKTKRFPAKIKTNELTKMLIQILKAFIFINAAATGLAAHLGEWPNEYKGIVILSIVLIKLV